MSTPAEGDMTPDGDPLVVPYTQEYVDDDGNTVIVGYPSGSTTGYTGTPGTSADGPGMGVSEEGGYGA
ncbi:hypothetical protein ACWCXC_15570 [Streptomyces sp. NPDC001515]